MQVKTILTLLASGCIIACSSGGGDSNPGNPDLTKIRSWQQREAIHQDTQENDYGILDNADRSTILDRVTLFVYNGPFSMPTYAPDPEDYWQTSSETADRGAGDCEDLSAYWYRNLRSTGWFADNNLSMLWVTYYRAGERRGHMLLCIRTQDEPIYVSNNVVMSNLSHYKNLAIEYEFDLWSIW